MEPTRPASRDDFRIAIVCALRAEFDAVGWMLDHHWDTDYGRARGDINAYTNGRVGQNDVVLLCLADAGKVGAASATASLRSSYPQLELALLVGLCGGVPRAGTDRELLLGDVIFARHVVQYDLGRRYPGGVLEAKYNAEESLGRLLKSTRNLFAMLQTRINRKALEGRAAALLQKLQSSEDALLYRYPGVSKDRLFPANYEHKHRGEAICATCQGSDAGCEASRLLSCADLGCDESYLVTRSRPSTTTTGQSEGASRPRLVFGRVGSGDTALKSAKDRDDLAAKHDLDAVEMAGAGMWDELPCVVIKAVCDYADSHKNHEWHNYAAATAASAAAAFLERLPRTDASPSRQKSHFVVPFDRNEGFVGRKSTVDALMERIPPAKDGDRCQRTVVEGLGGIGKTQIALEAAYRVRKNQPNCSVFWVPAVSIAMFEKAYRDIGQALHVKGIDGDDADIKALVKSALSQSDYDWLLILDNADDKTLCYPQSGPGLADYLPSNHRGSILMTTRNHDVAIKFQQTHIVRLDRMRVEEASDLLLQGLKPQTCDEKTIVDLLDHLGYLPLAIRQASAYIAKTGMTLHKYLSYCRESDRRFIQLLSREFEDRGRYDKAKNTVAVTWLISFSQIEQECPDAARLLSSISFLGEKDIPRSLLPPSDDDLATDEAIGVLEGYAFLTLRDEESFDVHRLVQLAMRNWIGVKKELPERITLMMKHLTDEIPKARHDNRNVWMRYLPHMEAILRHREHCTNPQTTSRLLYRTAEYYDSLAKYPQSEELYKEILQIHEATLGREDVDTVASMNNLSLVLQNQGKYSEAGAIQRIVVVLSEKVLGRENPDTLVSMNNLATLLRDQRNYEEAEVVYRETLELSEKILGLENLSKLTIRDNLAVLLKEQGKHDEAEALLGVADSNKLDSTSSLEVVPGEQVI